LPSLNVIIDSHIHLDRGPPSFIKLCKKELTFNNPEYLDAVKHGRSARGIPRKIRSYTEENSRISLPRGYWARFAEAAQENGHTINCDDRSLVFKPRPPPGIITPRDYQQPWVNALLNSNQGVGVAPPGSGKTIMALMVYAALGQPCLWLTHTGRLLRQTRKRASEFLGIDTGIIGKGKEEIAHFTVGTVQTLIRRDLSNYKDKFGLIILDECHHAPARSFMEVVSAFNAHYRYGLTATPYREDGLGRLMFQALGPALCYLDKEVLRKNGQLVTPLVQRRPTEFKFPYNPAGGKRFGYAALCDALATDVKRNQQIATDVVVESSIDENNVCIVLVGRIPHGEELHQILDQILPGVGFVHSKMSNKKSDEILDAFETGKLRILIATYRMLAEGFDYQPSNRLFLTAPFKGRSLIEQACGRIERTFPGKTDAVVFDYVDQHVGVLNRQADVRLDVYEANNTPVVTIV